jgi:hypothetical protein
LKEELGEQILRLEGVECKPSRLGGTDAFCIGSREIVHFHPGDEIDIRLSKGVVRSLTAEIAEDDRLTTRDRPSDWIEFKFSSRSDLDRALELIEMAWEVYR